MAVIRWTRRSAATSRSVLATLAVVGGVALAGCGAGQQAQTANQRPTVDGANVSVGSIALRDVGLAYPESGVYQKGGDARLEMVVVNSGNDSDTLVEVRTDAAQAVTLTAAAAGSSVTPEPTGTIGPSSTPTGTASGTPTGTKEPDTPSASAGTGEPSEGPLPSGSSSESPAPSPAASGSAGPTGATTDRIAIPRNSLVSFRGDAGPTVTLTGLTRQLRAGQVIRVFMVFQNSGQAEFDIAVEVPRGEIAPAPTVSDVPGGQSEG